MAVRSEYLHCQMKPTFTIVPNRPRQIAAQVASWGIGGAAVLGFISPSRAMDLADKWADWNIRGERFEFNDEQEGN